MNIAEILKGKDGIKLWSDTFGELILDEVSDIEYPINLIAKNGNSVDLTEEGLFFNDVKGVQPCIFPSKEMRDWDKFAWKKGDVLTTKTKSLTVVFDYFNATYESFAAKYSFCSYQEKNEDDAWNKEGENSYKTLCFSKVSGNEAKEFVKKIEEHYGGKPNLETLEIVQPKQEFKDRQIKDLPKKCKLEPFQMVLVRDENDTKWIADIFSHYDNDNEYPYACVGDCWKECIPYNDQTKHLLGTNDEWKGGEK